MALVTTKEMFAKALQSDYAIGAFNVNNMEIIQGIVHFVELYNGEYDRERLIYSLRAYEPKFIYAAGKAEKELRGVKRYVNLFYRIYNGRRKHSTLPMKF